MRRKWKKILLFNLVVLGMFFGACELVSYLYLVKYTGGDDPWTKDAPDLFRIDPLLGWSLRPGVRKFHRQAGWVQANSIGLRNKEIPISKPKDVFRIGCLGDSSTFVFEIMGTDDIYTTLLEKDLREKYNTNRIDVINASVPGYNTFQGLLLLKHALMKYSPDLVTVYLGNNEVYDGYNSPMKVRSYNLLLRVKRWVFRSYFVSVLRHYMFTKEGINFFKPDNIFDHEQQNFRTNIRAILEFCEEQKVAVVLCTVPTNLTFAPPVYWKYESGQAQEKYREGRQALENNDLEKAEELLIGSLELQKRNAPAKYDLGKISRIKQDTAQAMAYFQGAIDDAPVGRVTSRHNAALRKISETYKVPLIDLAAFFRKDDLEKGIVSPGYFSDHIHPNEKGQRIIADRLQDYVEKNYGERLSAAAAQK